LPFEGLRDARPGVAPAPTFAPVALPVAEQAAIRGLGLAGEFALGLEDRLALVAGDALATLLAGRAGQQWSSPGLLDT
jgi:hypothetical protein